MCDPITLGLMAAGTAASIGGGAIASREQTDNNTNIAAARNRALREVNAKSMAHAADSTAQLNTQLGATTGPAAAQDLQAQQQGAVGSIQGNMTPPVNAPTLNADAPTAAKSGLGAAIASAAGKSKDKAAAQGNLLGYTVQGRNNAMSDQDLTSGINLNNNFVHGDNAILPSSMDYEQIKTNKPSSGIGEMLSGLGSAAGSVAGKRAGAQGFSLYR